MVSLYSKALVLCKMALSLSSWRASPGCPEHVRFVLEKAVNALPPEWLTEPVDGEVFTSIEECQQRLNAFSLSQGFDIVKTHSAMKPQPKAYFACIHHGKETRNWRKLPHEVEKDREGKIVGS